MSCQRAADMISPDEKHEIENRLLDNQRVRDIAEKTGISLGTISKIGQDLKETKNFKNRVKIMEKLAEFGIECENIAEHFDEFDAYLKLKLGNHGGLLQKTVKKFEEHGRDAVRRAIEQNWSADRANERGQAVYAA